MPRGPLDLLVSDHQNCLIFDFNMIDFRLGACWVVGLVCLFRYSECVCVGGGVSSEYEVMMMIILMTSFSVFFL
jgi:hypothetical protein